MPYPFLRSDERRSERPAGPTPGVLVVHANGVKHFFPGGNESIALALAKQMTPVENWNAAVGVQWGEKRGKSWICHKVLKGSAPLPEIPEG